MSRLKSIPKLEKLPVILSFMGTCLHIKTLPAICKDSTSASAENHGFTQRQDVEGDRGLEVSIVLGHGDTLKSEGPW